MYSQCLCVCLTCWLPLCEPKVLGKVGTVVSETQLLVCTMRTHFTTSQRVN